MSIFEKATRQRLRFTISKLGGNLTTEDLWHLSLEDLDTIAKSLNKEVKESAEESFIKTRSSANATLELKLEVVKHIITVKLLEKEKKELAKEKAAKKAKLDELIEGKQNEILSGKSIEELMKERASLED